MAVQKSEVISLGLQFVASFCWAIGAAIAGLESASDYLQFFAAVAWCVANFASAVTLKQSSLADETLPADAHNENAEKCI